MPTDTTVRALIDGYDVLLLDAYGVLVHAEGAMPGAADVLAAIAAAGKRFFVVTNDASKLPETGAARYRSFGLPIDPEHMITSGMLLARTGLDGARCMVLGPPDTERYVEQGGGVVVAPDEDASYDAVVVGDDAGYPFLDTLDIALTALYRHLDRGDAVRLILPNPDLLYPKSETRYGFTAGGAAMLLEAALARRYPARELRFERLGKPHRPIFDEARRRAGTDKVVMVGDQLETDIAGAIGAGIDAALLDTGVSRWRERAETVIEPKFLLRTLVC
jgi:HAD superfamily hydrolase (TIGR01459 family)